MPSLHPERKVSRQLSSRSEQTPRGSQEGFAPAKWEWRMPLVLGGGLGAVLVHGESKRARGCGSAESMMSSCCWGLSHCGVVGRSIRAPYEFILQSIRVIKSSFSAHAFLDAISNPDSRGSLAKRGKRPSSLVNGARNRWLAQRPIFTRTETRREFSQSLHALSLSNARLRDIRYSRALRRSREVRKPRPRLVRSAFQLPIRCDTWCAGYARIVEVVFASVDGVQRK